MGVPKVSAHRPVYRTTKRPADSNPNKTGTTASPASSKNQPGQSRTAVFTSPPTQAQPTNLTPLPVVVASAKLTPQEIRELEQKISMDEARANKLVVWAKGIEHPEYRNAVQNVLDRLKQAKSHLRGIKANLAPLEILGAEGLMKRLEEIKSLDQNACSVFSQQAKAAIKQFLNNTAKINGISFSGKEVNFNPRTMELEEASNAAEVYRAFEDKFNKARELFLKTGAELLVQTSRGQIAHYEKAGRELGELIERAKLCNKIIEVEQGIAKQASAADKSNAPKELKARVKTNIEITSGFFRIVLSKVLNAGDLKEASLRISEIKTQYLEVETRYNQCISYEQSQKIKQELFSLQNNTRSNPLDKALHEELNQENSQSTRTRHLMIGLMIKINNWGSMTTAELKEFQEAYQEFSRRITFLRFKVLRNQSHLFDSYLRESEALSKQYRIAEELSMREGIITDPNENNRLHNAIGALEKLSFAVGLLEAFQNRKLQYIYQSQVLKMEFDALIAIGLGRSVSAETKQALTANGLGSLSGRVDSLLGKASTGKDLEYGFIRDDFVRRLGFLEATDNLIKYVEGGLKEYAAHVSPALQIIIRALKGVQKERPNDSYRIKEKLDLLVSKLKQVRKNIQAGIGDIPDISKLEVVQNNPIFKEAIADIFEAKELEQIGLSALLMAGSIASIWASGIIASSVGTAVRSALSETFAAWLARLALSATMNSTRIARLASLAGYVARGGGFVGNMAAFTVSEQFIEMAATGQLPNESFIKVVLRNAAMIGPLRPIGELVARAVAVSKYGVKAAEIALNTASKINLTKSQLSFLTRYKALQTISSGGVQIYYFTAIGQIAGLDESLSKGALHAFATVVGLGLAHKIVSTANIEKAIQAFAQRSANRRFNKTLVSLAGTKDVVSKTFSFDGKEYTVVRTEDGQILLKYKEEVIITNKFGYDASTLEERTINLNDNQIVGEHKFTRKGQNVIVEDLAKGRGQKGVQRDSGTDISHQRYLRQVLLGETAQEAAEQIAIDRAVAGEKTRAAETPHTPEEAKPNPEAAKPEETKPETSARTAEAGEKANPDFERAMQLVKTDLNELHSIVASLNLTTQERFFIAKTAAADDAYGTSKFIQNYRLDKNQLFEIAKIAAAQNGIGTSAHIQNYGLTDKHQLYKIAKIAAAQYGGGTSANIQNYGLTDKHQLYEIAKIAAAQDGGGTSANIQNYGLTDKNQLFEIAKIAAAQDGKQTSEFIRRYELGKHQLFEIAKIAAAQDGGGTSYYIQRYKLDKHQLFEIAKIATTQIGAAISNFFKLYGLTDKNQLFEIAKIAAAQNGGKTSEYLHKFRLKDLTMKMEIFKIALMSNAIGTLKFASNYKLGIENFRQNENSTKEAVIEYVKNVLIAFGIKPEFSAYLYSDMQRRDAGIKLLGQLLFETNESLLKIPDPEANFTRYLLAKTIGLDPQLLYNGKISKRSKSVAGDLYELCLSIQRFFNEPVFKEIDFSKDMFEDKQLSRVIPFLHSLNRIVNILGEGRISPVFLKSVLSKLLSSEKASSIADLIKSGRIAEDAQAGNPRKLNLSKENIEKLTRDVDELFMVLFKQLFKIEGKNISMEDIKQLEKEWGSLDVFYTLIARYHGNISWQAEIPFFAKVVNAVLTGTFKSLKYEGDPANSEDQAKAKSQLSMLPDTQAKQGWRSNYNRVEIFKTSGPTQLSSEAQLLGRSKKTLNEQVKGHIKDFSKSKATQAEIDRLAEEIQKTPKPETIKDKDLSIILLSCLKLLETAGNTTEYKNILKLLSSREVSLKLPPQLKKDFKTLFDLLKYQETGNEAILFTTTTDDPKLLLMTGDLVDASSCQNYKTGSHIQTLLGYVVDGGVKVVLSYAVQKKHFSSPTDYERAVELIRQGEKPQFIPAKQILKIGDIEIKLPKATKRRVVKLGTTDKGLAGIIPEKEYAQTHFAEKAMDGQIKIVLTELAQKSKAVYGEYFRMTISASRNPLGIYSDVAGGIRTGEYVVSGIADVQ